MLVFPWCTVVLDVVFFRVLHQPWAFWLLSSLILLLVGASDRSHRPSCRRSSCDKWALKKKKKGTQKPLQLFTERHHNPSQNCGVHVRRTFCCFSPPLAHSLALWHREECVEGGRDGWMEGKREGVPCSSCLSLALFLSVFLSRAPSIWRVCWWHGSVLHFHL